MPQIIVLIRKIRYEPKTKHYENYILKLFNSVYVEMQENKMKFIEISINLPTVEYLKDFVKGVS